MGRFEKGKPRPPGAGRKKGSLNQATTDVRALARGFIDDPGYRDKLAARVAAGEAPHMETLLWHYGYGKPKDQVEITGGSVTVNLNWNEEEAKPEPADGSGNTNG